jgi:gliding motility-associated-like protein
MKKITFFLLLSWSSISVLAQTTDSKLVAHFCFDDCKNLATDCSNNASKAILSPLPPSCTCGPVGQALQLNGSESLTLVDVADKFNTSNFSIALYFKPLSAIGTRDIITNRIDSTCDKKRVFAITYNASARSIVVTIKDEKRGVTLNAKIDNDVCWQHIVVTREANYHRLWLNGKIKSVAYSPDNQRINLRSNSLISVGKSVCHPNVSGGQLKALIDDLRFYSNTALVEKEIKALYDKPDRIKTKAQLLFVGNQVNTEVTNTCAIKFSWSPTQGVENSTSPTTVIKPTTAGVFKYVMRFTDSVSTCTAYDTLRLTVVDPQTQPCGDVAIPNAFTPNNDGLNELFGISNPYTIGELIEFEILDRWGGKVFSTTDPFLKWDGKTSAGVVIPGQYVYRIRFKCQGEEKNQMGSFIVLQ